jgi:hypothetical protein
MAADFYSYLWLLAGYAKWLLTGGPFLVDTALKKYRPNWAAWLDKIILPETRRRFEIGLLLLAVFIAGFLAWRDEHTARLAAEGHGPGDSVRHLIDDQKARLIVGLKLSPEEHYNIEFNSIPNCDECEEYAEELRDFVSSIPGWKADGGPITFAAKYQRGLNFSANKTLSPDVTKKIVAAFDSANVPLSMIDPQTYPGGIDAIIVVARRPK